MSYKTIVVDVNGSKHMQQRLEIALTLAQLYEAHLVGAGATSLPADFYMPGIVGDAGAAQAEVYLDYLRERAKLELAQFEARVQQAGLPSYESRLITREADVALATQARYADLVILGQADPDESLPARRKDVQEYVVMNAGRPVLMVPYAGTFKTLGQHILLAWDAGTAATRAVTAALPFLKRAKLVEVLVFHEPGDDTIHGPQPGADLALYLARHGVPVQVTVRPAMPDIDVGNALLSHAADSGADMLVMGAYGHSRLREILLGGVTETIFKSMTIPTLLAH